MRAHYIAVATLGFLLGTAAFVRALANPSPGTFAAVVLAATIIGTSALALRERRDGGEATDESMRRTNASPWLLAVVVLAAVGVMAATTDTAVWLLLVVVVAIVAAIYVVVPRLRQ